MQFSMKTISYYQLHLSLPAWRGWLKSLWHILFLVHSQAQMVSGKTILAKLCVRMFIRICFAISHFIFASFCKSFTFSTLSAVRYTGTFKMAGIFVSLLQFKPLAGTYSDVFEGITNRVTFSFGLRFHFICTTIAQPDCYFEMATCKKNSPVTLNGF